MTEKRDANIASGLEGIVPGKDLEKAAAEVATDAGKGLVQGVKRVLGAATAEWIVKKEAKAESARKAIETQAEIDRANALTEARRASELSEIDHHANLELAKRRAERMLLEMAHQQQNFEAITRKSLMLIESAPSDSQAGELDEEWLFRFAGFAEQISDQDLQNIWARVLRSASVKGKQKLSAASLLQLSLVDKDAALDFEKFCKAFRAFGMFPAHEKFYEKNALGINVRMLEELGLIQHTQPTSLQLNDVRFELGMEVPSMGLKLFHMAFVFTHRGAEIATAIFGQELIALPEDQQDTHLQDVIRDMMHGYEMVLVMPRASAHYLVVHRQGKVAPLPEGVLQSLSTNGEISERLCRLLSWAAAQFSITVHEIPKAKAP